MGFIVTRLGWSILVVLLILRAQAQVNALPEAIAPAKAEDISTPDPVVDSAKPAASRPDFSGYQSSAYQLPPGEDPENRLLSPFAKHLMDDQKEFWTLPGRIRVTDLKWAVPAAGVVAAAVASDSWIEKQIPARIVGRSQRASNYAVYSLAGLSAGSYLLGQMRGNDHLAETGMLSAEAAANSMAVAYLFKDAFERQRPDQGGGHGNFFAGGNSFPSEHAAVAWAVASVWAHEYPGTLSQISAYGLASAVSLTRITGKQHFASDVLVGSALGWYFARQAYRAHHDSEAGGAPWGNPLADDVTPEASHNPRNMGSPYVPIDSWVYAAFDRLIALGYVTGAYLGIRPWTRLECARLLDEAEDRRNDLGAGGAEDDETFSALKRELQNEGRRLEGEPSAAASLDSVYVRTTAIGGTPLRDGFHFGQTIINDYGRPFGEGFNAIAGVTAHGQAGPLAFSLEGEYQHAPAVASDPLPVLQATAAADNTLPLSDASPESNRLQLLAGDVSMAVNGIQFSFGRESLWLGPGDSGPFLYSDNAEPMTMLRIDAVAPYDIPLLSHLLGPARSQFFLGRFSGQRWEESPTLFGPNLTSQPFLQGISTSFHPTPNLEFGMGFTAQFGGEGNPFTWASFLRTFYSHRANPESNPGKRLSEFNFNYRVPGLRDWLQFYVDSMVIDEYSPIGSTRPAINPGLYLPRLPKLHKMELRLEGITDDLNWPSHFGPGAFYTDVRYRSGYTNDGNLIGSWVGRQGRGEQGWLTYRFSPRTYVQAEYRHNNVDPEFLSGGQLRDLTLRAEAMLTEELSVSGLAQQENWRFPVLFPAAKSDVAAALQLTFWPQRRTKQE